MLATPPQPNGLDSAVPEAAGEPLPVGVMVLWVAYIVMLPHYVFESGGPQPADGILALLVLVLAARWSLGSGRGLALVDRPFLVGYGRFTFYVMAVNATWGLILTNPQSTVTAAYYAYNFSLLALFLLLAANYRDQFIVISYWAMLFSLAGAVVATLGDLSAVRPTGPFNNPNQLGYFAVVAPTLMSTLPLKRRTLRPIAAELLAWILAAFLVVASASIAALTAYSVGAILVLLVRLHDLRVLLLVPLATLAIVNVGSSWFSPEATSSRLERVQDRSDAGLVVQEFDNRGYDRLVAYPQYLVLGAGEGADERFVRSSQRGELHSSIGVLIFSYGLVGLYLFTAPLAKLVRGGGGRHVAMLAPAFVYGFTHQGLRFRLFWLLLAAVAHAAATTRQAREEPPSREVTTPAAPQ